MFIWMIFIDEVTAKDEGESINLKNSTEIK